MVRLVVKSANSEVRLPGFKFTSFGFIPPQVRLDLGTVLRIKLDHPCKVLSLVLGTHSGPCEYSLVP